MHTSSNGSRTPARSIAGAKLRTALADDSGTTAIEFGMVATPFFMMLFGIIAVGLYFFTMFTLENAVEGAARLIRTGQIQNVASSGSPATYTYPASFNNVCSTSDALDVCFKKQVCKHLPTYVDCTNKLRINVQNFTDFASVAPMSCLSGGNLVANGSYNPGVQNVVVLVTACYEWALAGQMPFLKLGHMTNGSALIQASTTFVTEPY